MRSLLFVPGSRPDRIAKALGAGADAVCVDLEDAVPPGAKGEARSAVKAALADTPGFGIRINNPLTEYGRADLKAFAGTKLPFVMIPKADSPADIAAVVEAFGTAECPPLIPIIESAEGLKNAWDTAATPGVSRVMFGGGDLSAELGVALAWEPLLFARSLIVAAAARAGVETLDVPWLDVSDEAGLTAESQRAKALGYTAKACIHPAQVAAVNAAFSPGEAEIAEAQDIIAALKSAGGGAALHKGKLIEKPLALGAERVLQRARTAGLI